jgi:hypothetical protein
MAHRNWAGSQIQVCPGPGYDRIQHQFVVSLWADNNQPNVWTYPANCLQNAQAARRRVQVYYQIFHIQRGKQLFHFPGYRNQLSLAHAWKLIEDAGQTLQPYWFVCDQAHSDRLC